MSLNISTKTEEIQRVQFENVAEVGIGRQSRQIGIRCDLGQRAFDKVPCLLRSHSSSG